MDQVIFAIDPRTVPLPDVTTVIISPGGEKWNDFGSQIQVNISVEDPNHPTRKFTLRGYFAFIGSEREGDVRLLRRLLSSAPNGRLPSNQIPKFFTMLPDMSAYRQIVTILEPDLATRLLAKMNDVVAADEGFMGTVSLQDVRSTRAFNHAFLRSSEAYFAWTNAGSILRGLEHEEIGAISNTFNIRFKLSGRPNEHDLSFKFDVTENILPRRFAIVIGKNGVGKSQTLGMIAKAALSGGDELTDGDGDRPFINRLLAFVPTHATSSIFPSERRSRPRIWYRRFALSQSGSARGRRTTSDVLVQLARSEERVHDRDRLHLFMTAIAAIDDWEDLGLRILGGKGSIAFHELRSGGEEERLERYAAIDIQREPIRMVDGKPYPLSSGEQSFLRFAAIASLHIENGTLVLLDEPETHLHPNFISQFVAILDNLLEQTGSAAIIATHSAYFVREAFEDQVIVLRSEADRRIVAQRPNLKTFGADVGSISYFVFGEDQPSRLARKVEKRIMDDSSSWSETFEAYKDELSLELLGDIRARIEPPRPTRPR
ncbi:AAA family ATPase [Methylorubrum sp. SB2]|uniref:AAA family ATPase n=1 Tax=Methylorubrum subtropicum TaxID=3138812 RepID=UPI00313DB873